MFPLSNSEGIKLWLPSSSDDSDDSNDFPTESTSSDSDSSYSQDDKLSASPGGRDVSSISERVSTVFSEHNSFSSPRVSPSPLSSSVSEKRAINPLCLASITSGGDWSSTDSDSDDADGILTQFGSLLDECDDITDRQVAESSVQSTSASSSMSSSSSSSSPLMPRSLAPIRASAEMCSPTPWKKFFSYLLKGELPSEKPTYITESEWADLLTRQGEKTLVSLFLTHINKDSPGEHHLIKISLPRAYAQIASHEVGGGRKSSGSLEKISDWLQGALRKYGLKFFTNITGDEIRYSIKVGLSLDLIRYIRNESVDDLNSPLINFFDCLKPRSQQFLSRYISSNRDEDARDRTTGPSSSNCESSSSIGSSASLTTSRLWSLSISKNLPLLQRQNFTNTLLDLLSENLPMPKPNWLDDHKWNELEQQRLNHELVKVDVISGAVLLSLSSLYDKVLRNRLGSTKATDHAGIFRWWGESAKATQFHVSNRLQPGSEGAMVERTIRLREDVNEELKRNWEATLAEIATKTPEEQKETLKQFFTNTLSLGL